MMPFWHPLASHSLRVGCRPGTFSSSCSLLSRKHRLTCRESHLSVELLDFVKVNGVMMLSFPPQCSHKLQPLDRCVYRPFKKYYNSERDGWFFEIPGRTMTIYDIAGVIGKAFPRAMTPINTQLGCCKYYLRASSIHIHRASD